MKGRGLEYGRESPNVGVWPSQAHSSAEPYGPGLYKKGGWDGLTLVWKQKMVTEMDTTAVMIIAMMTALVP